MQKRNYNTKQREFLIEFFENNPSSCYAVEDIMRNAEAANFAIGQTTVYRNLEMLVKEGFLIRHNSVGACVLFQYSNDSVAEHYHLYCTTCKDIIHLECTHIERLSKHIKKEHGFNVSGQETVFYGKCNRCAK